MSYKTYTLLVNAQPDPLAETEWNNEYTQADPIQPGGSVHGSLRYDGDIDRYTFTLLQAQTVRPRFSHEYYNNSDRYWVVSLDAQPNSGQRLQKIDVRGTDGDMGEAIQLAPGTYYISIEKYYFLSIPYTLHLDVVGK